MDLPLCRKIVWRCWPPLADDSAGGGPARKGHAGPGKGCVVRQRKQGGRALAVMHDCHKLGSIVRQENAWGWAARAIPKRRS